jgi:nitrite reductase/ring-hydroxylating ferredoxin subunit
MGIDARIRLGGGQDRSILLSAIRGKGIQEGGGRMAEYVSVGKVSELRPGQMKWVAVDRERVLLVNVDGAYYALKDQCGHQRAPLSRGKLQGHVVECPLHFARFDVRTGHLLAGPVGVDVPIYEVRIEADTVYVKGGTD